MKNNIKNIVAGAIGILGLIVASIQNVANVSEAIASHFWWVLCLSSALVISAAWPSPIAHSAGFSPVAWESSGWQAGLKRYGWVLLITLIAGATGSCHIYEQYFSAPLAQNESIFDGGNPIPVIETTLPSKNIIQDSIANGEELRVESFHLNSDKTSYAIDEFCGYGRKGAPLPSGCGIPYYTLPQRFSTYNDGELYLEEPNRYDGCRNFRSNPKVLEALHRFVIARDRPYLVKYLGSSEMLERLVRRRAAVLPQILPQGLDWADIAKADRKTLLDWTRLCIGLPYPVFTIEVNNISDHPILITAIRYYMLADYGAAGGNDGPQLLTSIDVFPHPLPEMKHNISYLYKPLRTNLPVDDHPFTLGQDNGTIRVPPPYTLGLKQSLVVPPGQIASFEIQPYPSVPMNNLAPVLMAVELVTNTGTIRVPEFFLDWPSRAG